MEHHRIAIVGSGFGGIGMAARLLQEGIDDFVVLERAGDVGGTWRDNTYPGCSCDVYSHLYSFSFAPNPDWSQTLAPQGEIQAYLQRCADELGVRPYVRLDTGVEGASWDDGARVWHLETSGGPMTAAVLVSAVGVLSDPVIPDVAGRDAFRGTAFHTACWDHEHDLTGERVAVIGTGSSGAQVIPEIQRTAGRLLVFQRTPAWVVPRLQRPIPEWRHRLYRRLPIVQRLVRALIFASFESIVIGFKQPWMGRLMTQRLVWSWVEREVPDPELRAKLRPSYQMGCKRLVISSDYYRALTQPNAEVVTAPIAEIGESSIRTADGAEHEIDTIVWATGFHVTDPPITELIRGRDGETLAERWRRAPRRALHGSTVAGFPNLFMLGGPNTGTGNNSFIYMLESQIAYVLDALRMMDTRPVAAVEPTAEAEAGYGERVQELLKGTVWHTGCSSHYIDVHGQNTSIWPDFMTRFRLETRHFDPGEYVLHEANGNGRAQAGTGAPAERAVTG